MNRFFESLESRRLLNGAITGGPGHAGYAVDVHGPNGAVVGVVQVDYYAAGYFGETAGTEGSSGNPITGAQGRLMIVYTPNTSINQMFHNQPERIFPTSADDDEAELQQM